MAGISKEQSSHTLGHLQGQLQISHNVASFYSLFVGYFFLKMVTVWSETLGWKLTGLDYSTSYSLVVTLENRLQTTFFSHLINQEELLLHTL